MTKLAGPNSEIVVTCCGAPVRYRGSNTHWRGAFELTSLIFICPTCQSATETITASDVGITEAQKAAAQEPDWRPDTKRWGGVRAGENAPSITCPQCRKTSYHPKDIEHGYCGYCHEYTTPRNT